MALNLLFSDEEFENSIDDISVYFEHVFRVLFADSTLLYCLSNHSLFYQQELSVCNTETLADLLLLAGQSSNCFLLFCLQCLSLGFSCFYLFGIS